MHRRDFIQRAGTGAVAASVLAVAGPGHAQLRRAVFRDEIHAVTGADRLVLAPLEGLARSSAGWRLGGLKNPVAGAGDGALSYICEALADAVLVVDRGGRVVHRWGGFNTPSGVALVGDEVHVADRFNHQIVALDRRGRVLARYGEGLNAPRGLAVDGRRVWVADSGNGRVVAYLDGRLVEVIEGADWVPRDVLVDDAGRVHVASAVPAAVRTFAGGRMVAEWRPAGLPRSVTQLGSTVLVGVA